MIKFDEEIQEIVKSSSGIIKQKLQEQLTESLISQLSYNLRDQVSEIASEFVKNELAEDIKNILGESKDSIISGIQQGIIEISAEIAQNMVAKAKKNMSNSWEFSKITEAMFK